MYTLDTLTCVLYFEEHCDEVLLNFEAMCGAGLAKSV